jgi:eukaryotic-like serine/threonine-protein kinase
MVIRDRAVHQYNNPMLTDNDERLALIISGLTEQARRGETPDVEVFARQHPELATELKELWAVAQFADLARSSGEPVVAQQIKTEDDPVALPRTFGDFTLLNELGRGGMGVVYQAHQRSLNRTVAVKMIREARLASAGDRARFRAEAEAVARLHHPNIVTVHEVGSAEGQAYLCLEYVEGQTLAQRLISDGPLPPREAARLLNVIARAVQHAHEQGVLHRDLKPSNILLSSTRKQEPDSRPTEEELTELNPKVSDFGLAKLIDRTETLTRTGDFVGTPSYMAPEQATNRREITPAADVYSLGAILYELLTGRPPFQASNPVDTLLLVLEQEPVPPRDLNPSVDRDLELICLKCLQKPTELRYHTAADLANDLEALATRFQSRATWVRSFPGCSAKRTMQQSWRTGDYSGCGTASCCSSCVSLLSLSVGPAKVRIRRTSSCGGQDCSHGERSSGSSAVAMDRCCSWNGRSRMPGQVERPRALAFS